MLCGYVNFSTRAWMTALVMTSEVDLALERILGDRNVAPASKSSANLEFEDGKRSDDTGAMESRKKDESNMERGEESMGKMEIGSSSSLGGGSSLGGESSNQTKSEFIRSTYEYLIDDTILSMVIEAHRAAKTGLFFLYEAKVGEDEDEFRLIVDEQYVDVFGQPLFPSSKTAKAISQLECLCPQCHQSRLASRFAPHLEKCMGMGRNSSRIASRRLAAAAAADNANSSVWRNHHDSTPTMGNGRGDGSSDGTESEDGQLASDDDDDDWTSGGNAFGKRQTQRKRGVGGGTRATPRKRGGGNAKMTPRKNANLRSSGNRSVGDMLLNETVSKTTEGGKKMRKTNSYSKLSNAATSSSTQSYDIDMEMGTGDAVHDFLNMTDSYDPPSPSF